MHFGPIKTFKYCLVFLTLFVFACRDSEQAPTFTSPMPGDQIIEGRDFVVKVDVSDPTQVDNIRYLMDGKPVGTVKGTDSLLVPTNNLRLGYRIITAIVSAGSNMDTINTNIVLVTNKAPKQLKYRVINSFPHQTSAYTQGLSYVEGKLLESTGEKGASMLKYVDLKTGKDLQQFKLPSNYFGEGSVKINDKIVMLTWQERVGLIFDAKTFKQIGTFPYEQSPEGWGLTFDGRRLLRSDGSNRIWYMNASTYKEEGYLEIFDHNGPVKDLNELEYINGKIFANVYQTSKIIRIDPSSGRVEAELDLSALVPKNFWKTSDEEGNNVLNGIAWDAVGKRLFVVGKKWPKLYEIKLME